MPADRPTPLTDLLRCGDRMATLLFNLAQAKSSPETDEQRKYVTATADSLRQEWDRLRAVRRERYRNVVVKRAELHASRRRARRNAESLRAGTRVRRVPVE